MTKIPEHYHISVYTKDDFPELTVTKIEDGWAIIDDWNCIKEKNKFLFVTFKTLKEATDFAYAELKREYPDCEKCYGAGFPDFWNKESEDKNE